MSFESYHQSTITPHSKIGYWVAHCVTCDWEATRWEWIEAVKTATKHWHEGSRD